MTATNRTFSLVLAAAIMLSLWLPTLAVPAQAASAVPFSELA